MLRPASWLALLSRRFTFELWLAVSPRANFEYDYIAKQSIPTAGLSPASPTALWAAVPDLTPSIRFGSDPMDAPKRLDFRPGKKRVYPSLFHSLVSYRLPRRDSISVQLFGSRTILDGSP